MKKLLSPRTVAAGVFFLTLACLPLPAAAYDVNCMTQGSCGDCMFLGDRPICWAVESKSWCYCDVQGTLCLTRTPDCNYYHSDPWPG